MGCPVQGGHRAVIRGQEAEVTAEESASFGKVPYVLRAFKTSSLLFRMGGRYSSFIGKKTLGNESIFMQIWDKVMAQTNNPAQQPKKQSVKEKGKTCSYAFNTIPSRSQV